MKYNYRFFIIFLSSVLAQVSYGQTQVKNGSVNDIAFIQGHWKATTADGRSIEAVWMAPENNNILGFMRMMKAEKADLYEILAYEQSELGFVSLVKHFKPGLLGQEEKDKQDRYNFIEATKDRTVFEKEGGGLRILYEKRSVSQFVIARGNLQDGQWVFKDLFVFNNVK